MSAWFLAVVILGTLLSLANVAADFYLIWLKRQPRRTVRLVKWCNRCGREEAIRLTKRQRD